MKVKGVDFVFYNVSDIKKAVKFYKDILGLKPLGKIGETWAEFDTGNITLAIGKFGPIVVGGVQVALALDDVKKALVYLKKKKVKIVQEYYESGGCYMAIVADPDGNGLIIHERKDGTVG